MDATAVRIPRHKKLRSGHCLPQARRCSLQIVTGKLEAFVVVVSRVV
jgi:hypothetical protein